MHSASCASSLTPPAVLPFDHGPNRGSGNAGRAVRSDGTPRQERTDGSAPFGQARFLAAIDLDWPDETGFGAPRRATASPAGHEPDETWCPKPFDGNSSFAGQAQLVRPGPTPGLPCRGPVCRSPPARPNATLQKKRPCHGTIGDIRNLGSRGTFRGKGSRNAQAHESVAPP